MATSSAPLAQVTVQVRAMQKAGQSERRIAAELNTTRNVVHTILTKGAQVTRGKAKRALLRWIGAGGDSSTGSAVAKRPVGRPRKAGRPAGRRGRPRKVGRPVGRPPKVAMAAPTRRRRRRRRTGARLGRPPMAMTASNSGGATSLEINGRTIRLKAGSRYIYRDGSLYHAL